jgi:hypothetical protein
MSGGKRKNEDVSDTMALVQAACKVLAITARPLAHFRHRRQPVRSAIGAATKPRANGAERHVSRERLLCVAAAVSVCRTATEAMARLDATATIRTASMCTAQRCVREGQYDHLGQLQ